MSRRIFLVAVLIALVGSLFVKSAKAQGTGMSDVPCASLPGTNGAPVELIVTAENGWRYLDINQSISFDIFIQFLAQNKIVVPPTGTEYGIMQQGFPGYLCVLASTDGNNMALVQQTDRGTFQSFEGMSVETYVSTNGYTQMIANQRPVAVKTLIIPGSNPVVRDLDIVYLVQNNAPLTQPFFEINLYSLETLWKSDANLTQIAASPRLQTEQLDIAFEQNLARMVGSPTNQPSVPTTTGGGFGGSVGGNAPTATVVVTPTPEPSIVAAPTEIATVERQVQPTQTSGTGGLGGVIGH